jgi:hypothetical protein
VEVLDNLLYVALLSRGKFLHPGLRGGAAKHLPELFVREHFSGQLIPLRHELLLHLAQFLIVSHCGKVVYAVLDLIQLILRLSKRKECVLECGGFRGKIADLLQSVTGHY